MPWRTAVVAGLCVAVLAARIATLSAHHSHANYDVTTWTVMEGTVKQLVLMAPHSVVYLEVKDDKGTVATWALEATNQRAILNNGVKREDVRPGEEPWVHNGQAVVRLGREVDDRVDLVLAQDVLDDVQVGDVRLDERNLPLRAFEVRPVAGVCQEVERD